MIVLLATRANWFLYTREATIDVKSGVATDLERGGDVA
jgi:hypothetical protein